MFDLELEADRLALAKRIREDIDVATMTLLNDGPRSHLGASLIGHECAYYLWLAFRWVSKDVFEPRMLRLFERGRREEEWNIRLLRAAGFEVWEVDPSNNKQFRIHGAKGHFGGSLDAISRCPPTYEISFPLLTEFKTCNSGQFKKAVSEGVKLWAPKYYAQMCEYGKHYGFHFALFWCVNKNDDDIYIEIVELDWNYAKELDIKADEIVFAAQGPERLSEDPSYYTCKYCPKLGVCHNGEAPEKNCRSCRYAEPIEDAQWRCNHPNVGAGQVIPTDFIPTGCVEHLSVINA